MSKLQSFGKFIQGRMRQKSGKVQDLNDVDAIHEYPEEANRQIVNFQYNIHRPKWEDHMPDEPPQDEVARDAYHAKHGLRMLPNNATEENVHQVKRHLDHYHSHYPDVAKEWNMHPLNSAENKIADVKNTMYDVKQKGGLGRLKDRMIDRMVYAGAKAGILPVSMHNKRIDHAYKQMGDALQAMKNDGGLDELRDKADEHRSSRVHQFKKENPDLLHMNSDQAYGHYHHWDSHKNSLARPMDRKEFHKHWNK